MTPPATPAGTASQVTFDPNGRIARLDLRYGEEWRTLDFRSDAFAGPAWYVEEEGRTHTPVMSASTSCPNRFEGAHGKISFSLEYAEQRGCLTFKAALSNHGTKAFRPVKAGVRLGLDTCMVSYPDWNRKLFPTLLRCERTHFWGYCMSPEGTLLGLGSPDPIASWSLNYNIASYGDYGHHIETLNLDFLNVLPLPPRHPHIDELAPGESRAWTVFLAPVSDLDHVKPVLAGLIDAPLFAIDRLTLAAGETAAIQLFSPEEAVVTLERTDGERARLIPENGAFSAAFTESDPPGIYTLRAVAGGKESEALLFRRPPWSWYLKQARKESLRIPQKACTHNEAWMGLYTQWLARLHFPDPALDSPAEAVFADIVPRMYDLPKGDARYAPSRIQNTAHLAGVCTAKYRCTRDPSDLEAAARLADTVLTYQRASGALFGNAGKGVHFVHYTSVCYPAKSILEVALEEKKLAGSDPVWRDRFDRHWRGVKAAMDDLVRQKDNIDTEGEITFEDGMISCSAAQLGFFALQQDDPAERRRYGDAALYMLNRHRCLQQRLIPDCRMNGCTLRFWEAQYDILLLPNMMNSPHGWTSWKTYATWYAYLLTGEEPYLEDTLNTLGACLQSIDADTGRLRWAFVPDPYVQAEQFGWRTHYSLDLTGERVFVQDPTRPRTLGSVHRVVGEQYLDMISDIYPGWGCDNDVHEHFKCLEETALTYAYVLEREDGSLRAWNARCERTAEGLMVTPAETCVRALHVNLKGPRRVTVRLPEGAVTRDAPAGMSWIGQNPL